MLCVFCGESPANTKDHTPPKCFFQKPLPVNMITVPTCRDCNDEWKNDADLARNLITSLETTESHDVIQQTLGAKRNRSWMQGKHGRSKARKLLSSLEIVDRYSNGGIFLRKSLALNLDQKPMDMLFDRLTRGLLHHETKSGYVACSVEWNIPEIDKFPDEFLNSVAQAPMHELGDKIFEYKFLISPGDGDSLWIYRFYGEQEFLVLLKRQKQEMS